MKSIAPNLCFFATVSSECSANIRLSAQENIQRIPTSRSGCYSDHGVHVHCHSVVWLSNIRHWNQPGHSVVL